MTKIKVSLKEFIEMSNIPESLIRLPSMWEGTVLSKSMRTVFNLTLKDAENLLRKLTTENEKLRKKLNDRLWYKKVYSQDLLKAYRKLQKENKKLRAKIPF